MWCMTSAIPPMPEPPMPIKWMRLLRLERDDLLCPLTFILVIQLLW